MWSGLSNKMSLISCQVAFLTTKKILRNKPKRFNHQAGRDEGVFHET
jgi:hypothetical protein